MRVWKLELGNWGEKAEFCFSAISVVSVLFLFLLFGAWAWARLPSDLKFGIEARDLGTWHLLRITVVAVAVAVLRVAIFPLSLFLFLFSFSLFALRESDF